MSIDNKYLQNSFVSDPEQHRDERRREGEKQAKQNKKYVLNFRLDFFNVNTKMLELGKIM